MPILVQHLSKRFGKHLVLDDLSFQLDTGTSLSILGRSGTGKSVLLHLLCGLIDPEQGTIEIWDPDHKEGELLVGMLFQNSALFDSLNVEQNVGFFLHFHRLMPPEKIKVRVREALSTVGLDEIRKKMPNDLSGGMRKRVALARLMICRPRVILYDEPTSGLDAESTLQIEECILNVRNQLKATMIIVTHDFSSALRLGDQVAILDRGGLTCRSSPDSFMEHDHPLIHALRRHAWKQPCEQQPKRQSKRQSKRQPEQPKGRGEGQGEEAG